MTHDNRVKPTHPARATSSCPVFTTHFADLVANFIEEFSREWAIADTRGIGLADADNTIDASWANPTSDGDPTRDGVRGSNERIGPLVDVQHDPLSSFEEDALALIQGIVQDNRGIGHILFDFLTVLIVLFKNIFKTEGFGAINAFNKEVLLCQVSP